MATSTRKKKPTQLDRIEASLAASKVTDTGDTGSLSVFAGQLEHVIKVVDGNGEGLRSRTARIEENIKATTDLTRQTAENVEKISTQITAFALDMQALGISVKEHHATDHFAGLIKKPKFWAVVVGGFIALHLISTYLPNVWNLVATLLGYPYLNLPLA
jgi:hypothetical protein